MKSIYTGTKVTVERLTPRSSLPPSFVVAFQFVAKAHLLRNDKTESGVVNLKIASQCRKVNVVLRQIPLSISNNLLNMHGRLDEIQRQMAGIDHLQEVFVRKPQAPVGRLGRVWPEGRSHWLGSIEYVKQPELHRGIGALPPSSQLLLWDRDESTRRI